MVTSWASKTIFWSHLCKMVHNLTLWISWLMIESNYFYFCLLILLAEKCDTLYYMSSIYKSKAYHSSLETASEGPWLLRQSKPNGRWWCSKFKGNLLQIIYTTTGWAKLIEAVSSRLSSKEGAGSSCLCTFAMWGAKL